MATIVTKCCTQCGKEKPLSAFYPRSGDRLGEFSAECRLCKNARYVDRYRTDAEWRAKVNARNNKRKKETWAANREKCCAEQRARLRRLKLEVQAAYGGACACCGETIPEFLAVDHINGNGNKHRESLRVGRRRAGWVFYYWLRKNGFPKDEFQLLCHNCNMAKFMCGGVCPHKRNREPQIAVAAGMEV